MKIAILDDYQDVAPIPETLMVCIDISEVMFL